MKNIDIVVPLFNEEEVVMEFFEALEKETSEIVLNNTELEFNFIFVDNGSVDETHSILKKLGKEMKNFNLIKLVRNFGIDGGIRAGLSFSDGDAAIILHGDLQDNPKIIKKLVQSWQDGFEQVVVRYNPLARESLFRKFGTYFYYKWATYASDGLIISGVSDFRLITKKVVRLVRSLEETVFLLRGIFIWPGYKYKIIDELKDKRKSGNSNINLPTVLRYFKLPISLSTRILYFIPILSSIIFMLSILFVAFTFFYFLITGNLLIEIEPRLTILIFINITLIMMVGILSAYIGVIFEEVKRRPAFIIDDAGTLGNKKI
jgi:dolichol-phosphate mannosyltransferase